MVGDDDSSRLQYAKPCREHGVAVRPAQKHAVARNKPLLLDQQPGDAPAEIVEVGIGPAAVIVDDRQRVRFAALQQLGGSIQPVGILQLRQIEAELRQQLRRRQAILDEAVLSFRHHRRRLDLDLGVPLHEPHDLDQRHGRIMLAHDLAP